MCHLLTSALLLNNEPQEGKEGIKTNRIKVFVSVRHFGFRFCAALQLLRLSITCGFFNGASVNRMHDGSSLPPTSAERAVIKSNR